MTVDELEKLYEKQQKIVVRYSSLYRKPIIGKFFLKKLIESKTKLQLIFVDLREQTRKIHPERFISSEGSQ